MGKGKMRDLDRLEKAIVGKINGMTRFGESKHLAKKEEKDRCRREGRPWNPSRVDGIFSYNTVKTYTEHGLAFARWMKENYPKIHRIKDIHPAHVQKYLGWRQRMGDSAWTIWTRASAMAKILGCSATDFNGKYFQLPKRKRENIRRSRREVAQDRKFSQWRNREIVEFAVGTGLRRRELASVRPEDVYWGENGRLMVHVEHGKGGRKREAPVLRGYEERVWAERERAIRESRERIFGRVPRHMDVHGCRRQYAAMMYRQVRVERRAAGGAEPKDPKAWYVRRSDGKRFERAVLRRVTEALGHGRLEVAVRHYLD